jgi:hypothetical protein
LYEYNDVKVMSGKKKVGEPKHDRVARSGKAIPSDDATFFHPREGSYADLFGKWMMPHRHTQFGDARVDLSKAFENNPTRKFVPGLGPLFPFSRSPTVDAIRRKVASHRLVLLPAGSITFCNANLYTKGDKLSLHKDPNTKDGTGHVVRTVTLGASRKYAVVDDATEQKTVICVQPGSLNVLGCDTNKECKHTMNPSNARGVLPRISLNFRILKLGAMGAAATTTATTTTTTTPTAEELEKQGQADGKIDLSFIHVLICKNLFPFQNTHLQVSNPTPPPYTYIHILLY